jgi:hypothetical protein
MVGIYALNGDNAIGNLRCGNKKARHIVHSFRDWLVFRQFLAIFPICFGILPFNENDYTTFYPICQMFFCTFCSEFKHYLQFYPAIR